MIINREYYHVVAWDDCPYCESAIKLLSERSLEAHVDYVDPCSVELEEAYARTGWDTVPMITRVRTSASGTIAQKFIGGFTDLQSYLESDEKEKEKDSI